MEQIILEIKNCEDCPFLKKVRAYTEDSFEVLDDWKCGKCEDKNIERYVSWNETRYIKIPNWCPVLVKK
jgi:ubiquitin C-terminal hydrolase